MSSIVENAITPAPVAAAAAPAAAGAKVDFQKSNTSLYVGDLGLDVSEPVLFEVRRRRRRTPRMW